MANAAVGGGTISKRPVGTAGGPAGRESAHVMSAPTAAAAMQRGGDSKAETAPHCAVSCGRDFRRVRRAVINLLDLDSRVADCLQPLPRILLQAPREQRTHARGRRWELLPVRFLAQHRDNRVGEVGAVERRGAGQHLEQHAAERPDVAPRVDRPPSRLLRDSCTRRSQDARPPSVSVAVADGIGAGRRVRCRSRLARRLRQTEVEHLHGPSAASLTLAGFRSR